MYKNIYSIMAVALLLLASCSDEKEDVVEQINKEGAVETKMSVEHIDNQYDVIVTSHKTWVKGNLVKDITHRDTIPALGDFIETNDKGEKVQGKKDYEIYFTAK